LGGVIPIDPLSVNPIIRTESDDRFLSDSELRAKVTDSAAIGTLDIGSYDIVYLAGGWGAAFDFGFSSRWPPRSPKPTRRTGSSAESATVPSV